ncbi:hypothetical protein PRABACTJOHN_03682 [Parabacteroides johnsonii DSM 18315]|uniref:Uncharacterized protein n=1 Tax=Parabacteroides johnsonii DSM 18315 TaxID=537006 RepID=B7BF54_9BACT|nr:hypothetical protein PRABACTJOHN_03682 [Parabacteroides johnsonii DSM 18315]
MVSRLTLTTIRIFSVCFFVRLAISYFLFYEKLLFFPLLEAFRLRPKRCFHVRDSTGGGTRTTDKKPAMKFYEIPQSAIAESCRQISFPVAAAVLELRSSTVSLHTKTELRLLPGQKEEWCFLFV